MIDRLWLAMSAVPVETGGVCFVKGGVAERSKTTELVAVDGVYC